MHNQYNQRGYYAPYPQNWSQHQGYSQGMNNTSIIHQREYQQSNQNQEFAMYPTDNIWYPNDRTQMRTLAHQYQMSAPSQERNQVSAKVENPKQSHENWRRMDQQDFVRLSKTLTYLLRHGAENLGFHFMPGGFLYVDQLLKYHKPLKGFTLMQIEELVRTNDKQQFALKKDDVGRLMIRANQGQQDIVRLSKTLAFLLRHGAENLGFHFMPGGFLYVDQLLKYHKPLKGFTLKQIEELVRTNDKQRFALKKDDVGRLMIRANQGHTTAVEGLDLSPIYDSSEVQMVVHGTYYQAWDQIQNTGLSRMNRNHIHFAAGMPGESGVISGMRKSCEVVIEIDLEKALKARIPFFRSANNVILSPGNEKGFIPPTFFKRVFDRHSGEELMPLDFLSVQVAAERSSQQCPMKRVREGQSEDEYPCKKRREDRSSSQKARFFKEESTSQSGTLKSKKDDGKFGKLKNEKDKEETKQMRSKDEKGDREKSRSDRDEKEEGTSEPQNKNERNMARPMRAQDEKEEITKSHSAKRKERTEQVRRKDEKEVGETSMNRSGEGKGEGKKLKFHTGEEQMKETRRQVKTEDNKVEVELRYGQWPKK